MAEELAVQTAGLVAVAISTVFAQPDAERLSERTTPSSGVLSRQLPREQSMVVDANDDLLAFSAAPQVHWRQLRNTNPLESTSTELKRRTDLVWVCRNPAACSAWLAPS